MIEVTFLELTEEESKAEFIYIRKFDLKLREVLKIGKGPSLLNKSFFLDPPHIPHLPILGFSPPYIPSPWFLGNF